MFRRTVLASVAAAGLLASVAEAEEATVGYPADLQPLGFGDPG